MDQINNNQLPTNPPNPNDSVIINPMPRSRISRLEEKRTQKQLVLSILGIIVLVALVFTLGIPLAIRLSIFVGNLKSNQPIPTTKDTTPPYPPSIAPLENATNSAQLKVEGYGEPGATLKLFLNNVEEKNIILGNDGSFSFSDLTLKKGQNTIYAIAIDSSKNTSSPSSTLTITYKSDQPTLEIDEPTEGQSFGHDQQTISIKGQTDPGNDVRINDRFVSVSDDGTFNYSLKLNDGDNTLTIVTKDSAGNETKMERKVSYNP